MYQPYCVHHDIRCLNFLGAVCLLTTYAGFACLIGGRGLHSSTSQLNLSRFGL